MELGLRSQCADMVEIAVHTGLADRSRGAPKGSLLGGLKDRPWGLVVEGTGDKSRLAAWIPLDGAGVVGTIASLVLRMTSRHSPGSGRASWAPSVGGLVWYAREPSQEAPWAVWA